MAHYKVNETGEIYGLVDNWRLKSLASGASILWPGETVWTVDNLRAFKACFTDKPDDNPKDSFEVKFEKQLAGESPAVTKLACELLLIYFLFSSNVKGNTKRDLIKTIAGWKKISIDDKAPVMALLDRGIGGAGQAYNTRRPYEVGFIATAALKLMEMSPSDRSGTLADHTRVATLLDVLEGEATFASRHILLHLMYPDQYERIASGGHKARIAEVFQEFIGQGSDAVTLDGQLLAIRQALEAILNIPHLDFYREPLERCWDEGGESGELTSLQALTMKRQIVLYGPPGTGKTYDARALAGKLIRQGVLLAWGPKRYFEEQNSVDGVVEARIRRIQLHPGYGYEDLVRGIHLVGGGTTEYRDGVLLNIIEELKTQPPVERDLPLVVILDEMNRADLSKVLGECFSLLEDRGGEVQLAGQDKEPRRVRMPENIHFIGTMNLIDQSLEQVDFALRRRFLWFFYGFEIKAFLAVAKHRWDEQHRLKLLPKPWAAFEAEFMLLGDRALALNKLIESHSALGRHYEIGHTYFCDIVSFVRKDLKAKPSRQQLLFNGKKEARGPVEALWKYSLRPLLEQYLSGVDAAEREKFLRQARTTLTAAKA